MAVPVLLQLPEPIMKLLLGDFIVVLSFFTMFPCHESAKPGFGGALKQNNSAISKLFDYSAPKFTFVESG